MGIHFKYTVPFTPQQNSCVEEKFMNPFNGMHVMLRRGKFTSFWRKGLKAEATNTAILLENNQLTSTRDLSLFQKHFNFDSKIW